MLKPGHSTTNPGFIQGREAFVADVEAETIGASCKWVFSNILWAQYKQLCSLNGMKFTEKSIPSNEVNEVNASGDAFKSKQLLASL